MAANPQHPTRRWQVTSSVREAFSARAGEGGRPAPRPEDHDSRGARDKAEEFVRDSIQRSYST